MALKKSLSKTARRPERGFLMFVYTVSIALIVLVLGLAIDAGVLYVIKVRLQAASDAGALAAARSLNLSLSSGQQISDAQNAASSFFGANFPNHLWETSGSTITANLAYGTGGQLNTLNVTTTASTNAPTYFMRWLGYTNVPLNVSGTASRRDVNLIMVIDQSGSMCTPVNGGPCTKADTASACSKMINAAESFVDRFSNNRDTLGLVVFNAGSQELFTAAQNFNPGMKAAIDGITCGGWTGTTAAVNKAYTRLQSLNQPGKLNAIILFTDGLANNTVANFPVNVTGSCSSLPVASLADDGMNFMDYTTLAQTNLMPAGCSASNIAAMPTLDFFSNATTGYRTNYNDTSHTFVSGQDLISSGAYNGYPRVDLTQALDNVAANTLDDQARRIRNDTTLNPMILTIGLGGNAGAPPDSLLLLRVANSASGVDPMGNPITNAPAPAGAFDPTRQVGLFVYSPSSAQLLSAFSRVGSFLIELTK